MAAIGGSSIYARTERSTRTKNPLRSIKNPSAKGGRTSVRRKVSLGWAAYALPASQSLYSKIEAITSSILLWIDLSSVTAQFTATWQALRGLIPWEINLAA